MSAGALENGDGVVADALLEEIQCDEEDEPFQSSVEAEASGACIPGGPPQGSDGPGSDPKNRGKNWFPTSASIVTGAVVAGAATVAAVPLGLTALGFTGTGIAASSIAAKMMSAAAIANGGGVAAGSLVATLQSVGAAGLSMSSNVLLGSVGAAFGGWLGSLRKESPPSPPAGPNTEAEGGPQGGGDSPKPSPPNDKPSAPRK